MRTNGRKTILKGVQYIIDICMIVCIILFADTLKCLLIFCPQNRLGETSFLVQFYAKNHILRQMSESFVSFNCASISRLPYMTRMTVTVFSSLHGI